MTTITLVEPPWEVNTPRGKADVLALIDYSQESYLYFLTAQRDTGAFWIYRNDKCSLFWNESTGLGKKENEAKVQGESGVLFDNYTPMLGRLA